MGKALIVLSVRSREFPFAKRSGVMGGEGTLQPLDLGNRLLDIHPRQYKGNERCKYNGKLGNKWLAGDARPF